MQGQHSAERTPRMRARRGCPRMTECHPKRVRLIGGSLRKTADYADDADSVCPESPCCLTEALRPAPGIARQGLLRPRSALLMLASDMTHLRDSGADRIARCFFSVTACHRKDTNTGPSIVVTYIVGPNVPARQYRHKGICVICVICGCFRPGFWGSGVLGPGSRAICVICVICG
jgi:hypothetical protein